MCGAARPRSKPVALGTSCKHGRLDKAIPKRRLRKRELFAELDEGLRVLADERLESALSGPALSSPRRRHGSFRISSWRSGESCISPARSSRPTFAPTPLENWEKGPARPIAQAALLIRLVERHPDTVQRLAVV